MLPRKFVKLFVFFGFAFLAITALQSPVYANEYDTEFIFKVEIDERNTAKVTQQIQITNTSEKYLSSSLEFILPYQVSKFKAGINGNAIPAKIDEGKIYIDFSKNKIDINQTSSIFLSYEITEFVDDYGALKRVDWAKFLSGGKPTKSKMTFLYPKHWGDLGYTSEIPNDEFDNEYYHGVVFRSDQKLRFFIGESQIINVGLGFDETIYESVQSGFPLALPTDSYEIELTNSDNVTIYQNDFEYHALLHSGELSMVLNSRELNLPRQLTLSRYSEGIDQYFSELDSKNSRELYLALLNKYDPKNHIKSIKLRNIHKIVQASSQSDLDYALSYVLLMRVKNIPAYISYGLVQVPDSDEFVWHFWPSYLKNGKWLQVDPFFEDLYGYDFYENVDPMRILWGYIDPRNETEEINFDGFYLDVWKLNFQSTAGIPNLHEKAVTDKSEAVLGLSTKNIIPQKDGIEKLTSISWVFSIATIILVFVSNTVIYEIYRKPEMLVNLKLKYARLKDGYFE